MSEQPWGAGEGSPMNEGNDDTAVRPGRLGERRAGEATAQDARGGGSRGDELEWGADESAQPGPTDLGVGQPNLDPDPPVPGRTPRFSPGATDDSAGNPPPPEEGGSRSG
jgi:hypothetical protein